MTSEQLLRECTVLIERDELPEVGEVYPLVAEYEKHDPHTVLAHMMDEGKLEDASIESARLDAVENGDFTSEALAKVILRMSEAQRGAL